MNKKTTKIEEEMNGGAERIVMPRRRFLSQAGLGLGAFAALASPFLSKHANAVEPVNLNLSTDDRFFRFAVIADTHIIGDFYTGPESNPMDTESIRQSAKRLESAR